MSIDIQHVSKEFGTFHALTDVNLSIKQGELVALLGPSGSGKTTLLRIIAGLESAGSGSVLFSGESVTHQNAKERNVGFVFQHYALFRHMTVFDNVAFGLRVKPKADRLSEAAIAEKVHGLLKLVQLDWVGDRYPSQLSGGQRQRIALARALAIEPKVLLLDEPFGALDAKVRKDLRKWLRDFHKSLNVTTILVTHDQDEALEVASRVVIMNEGKIEQEGTPEDVYHRPATPFVLNFLGNINLFHCRVEDNTAFLGNIPLPLKTVLNPTDDAAVVYIRPNQFDIDLSPKNTHSFKGIITYISTTGPVTKLELKTEWKELVHIELPHASADSLRLAEGQEVYVTPKKLSLFDQGDTDPGFYVI